VQGRPSSSNISGPFLVRRHHYHDLAAERHDKPQVLVTPVKDFVLQSPAGPCSQPVFDEKMENAEVKIHNGLAQVWATIARDLAS